jgi:hypothetical protein
MSASCCIIAPCFVWVWNLVCHSEGNSVWLSGYESKDFSILSHVASFCAHPPRRNIVAALTVAPEPNTSLQPDSYGVSWRDKFVSGLHHDPFQTAPCFTTRYVALHSISVASRACVRARDGFTKWYHLQSRIIIIVIVISLCGLMVRVPGYRAEMYCASCEVRTEFIYAM